MANRQSATSDRRTARRSEVHWPAKVFAVRADKYFPAETCNTSSSGVLLKVGRSLPVAPGDYLDVALGQEQEHTAVVPRDGMISARVVRVAPMDSLSQAVALHFLREERRAEAVV